MKIRKHLIFSGRVQGVGFRFRAWTAARELGLTGWVKNKEDGRVEMEVQGVEEEILQLLDRLENTALIAIADVEERLLPVVRWESRFEILN